MKIVSWNVNGLRAVYKKGFSDWKKKTKANFYCLQETRAEKEDLNSELLKEFFLNSAEKSGYSGTGVYTKQKPNKIIKEIGMPVFDRQARMLRMDLKDFILINFYLPHGGRTKENLPYKLNVYKTVISYLKVLKDKKVVICGDFNIAHKEIDLARPKDNRNNIMFTEEEREKIDEIVSMGYVDSFRKFNKKGGNYTWWPYFRNARQRNLGWRIDYVFVSKKLSNNLKKAFIQNKVMGSDHCPVGIELK